MRTNTNHNQSNIYSVTFSDIECSGGLERDIFEITGTSETRVRLHQVTLSQKTNVVGSSAERLPVEILTGAAAAASGGVAGVPLRYGDRGATALSAASYNSTTVATAASDETLRYAEVWPINVNFDYRPPANRRIQSALSERINVRLGVNAAAFGISGSIVWEEVGKTPGE